MRFPLFFKFFSKAFRSSFASSANSCSFSDSIPLTQTEKIYQQKNFWNLELRVADPDPWSGAFLDPGIRDG